MFPTSDGLDEKAGCTPNDFTMMVVKELAVFDKRMDFKCSACGQEFSYKIADLILATSDDTTTHEVRHREPHVGLWCQERTRIRLCSSPRSGPPA